jgi:hypothetical protein
MTFLKKILLSILEAIQAIKAHRASNVIKGR